MSLYSGARLSGWQAYLVPMALMAITDPILAAFYGVPALSKFQLFMYASFLISVWMGRRLRGTESVSRIAAFTVVNSIQFFLITNFGAWLGQARAYGYTPQGLLDCYIAALPFYRGTLIGDLVFTAILFGVHAVLARTVFPAERVARPEGAAA